MSVTLIRGIAAALQEIDIADATVVGNLICGSAVEPATYRSALVQKQGKRRGVMPFSL